MTYPRVQFEHSPAPDQYDPEASEQKSQCNDKGCRKDLGSQFSDGKGTSPNGRRQKQQDLRNCRPFHSVCYSLQTYGPLYPIRQRIASGSSFAYIKKHPGSVQSSTKRGVSFCKSGLDDVSPDTDFIFTDSILIDRIIPYRLQEALLWQETAALWVPEAFSPRKKN